MSALDVTNSMMDSEQQVQVTTAGNKDYLRTQLKGKESTDNLKDEVSTDTGDASTGKAGVSLVSKVYAGAKGEGGFGGLIGGEAEKTGKFLKKMPGMKQAGSALAGGVDSLGAKLTGKSLIGAINTGTMAGGKLAVPTDLGSQLDSISAAITARGAAGGLAPTETAAETAAKLVASSGKAPVDVAQGLADGAKLAPTAAAAGGAGDELAGKLLAAGGKFGGAMKGLGALGGVVDLGEDIVQGKIAGDNSSEKLGNKLTIAGTVLDFVPGMEMVGMGLNAFGAYESLKGSKKASDAQTGTDTTDLGDINKPSPAVHTWSQMGLVSSMAPDALHAMAGSTHF